MRNSAYLNLSLKIEEWIIKSLSNSDLVLPNTNLFSFTDISGIKQMYNYSFIGVLF